MNEIKTSGKWEEMGESEEQLFVESKTERGLIQLRQDKAKNRMTRAEALNLLEELRK